VPCDVVLAEWVKSALPALKNYVRPKWGILADGTCNNGMLYAPFCMAGKIAAPQALSGMRARKNGPIDLARPRRAPQCVRAAKQT
jgi:hypothetical protein